MEYRFTDGRLEQAPALAAELVSANVDVIVAAGGEAVTAARSATSTIPIVGTILGVDPVGAGLVQTLSRPGGNITGLSSQAGGTVARRLQLLKEAVPAIRRVAVLWNSNNPAKVAELGDAQQTAAALDLELLPFEVRADDDFDGAFRKISESSVDAFMALQEPLMFAHGPQVVAFAAQARLPSIYGVRAYPDAGGLMSYGLDQVDSYRRAAGFVSRILKGAKPADLPVEQPTKFDLVINLKTASAIGLAIPPSVLAQATEIIQ
jgi:putative ABC transport system substrate-binding protein